MKVAFVQYIASNPADPTSAGDYQADTLYHGLVKELGQENVQPLVYPWWMYDTQLAERPDDFKKIWGKGFTVYGNLDGNSEVTLCNPAYLENKTYDFVIIPIHHSSVYSQEGLYNLIMWLRNSYCKERIIVVDGWDQAAIDIRVAEACGTYFKRELYPEYEHLAKPISFAFPEEKIAKTAMVHGKYRHHVAPLVPVNQSIDTSYMKTYIYDNEASYYDMYQNSIFGLTSKKGGWDTMRHYEIIGNHCLPIFVDIEKCPSKTLFRFPKDLCMEVKKLDFLQINLKDGRTWEPGMVLDNCACIDVDNPGGVKLPATLKMVHEVNELHDKFLQWMYTEGTTRSLAKYVLSTCRG